MLQTAAACFLHLPSSAVHARATAACPLQCWAHHGCLICCRPLEGCPSTTPGGAQSPHAATPTGLMQRALCVTAACLTCAAALPVSCQQPPAYASCQVADAACTQLLAAHRGGGGGEGCIALSLVAVLLPRARPLSGARCNGISKHTATGLKQRILPCLQLSPLVEQRTNLLAQGRGAGKYDSFQ